MSSADRSNCRSGQIAAYLDGELDDHSETLLEEHLKECPRCSADVREQKRMLCVLDSAFVRGLDLPLPRNFARTVAVHAEADMSGMRDAREHWRAFRLCAVLAVASFALLGAASSKVVLGFGRTVLHQATGIADLAWKTFYDTVAGLAVVSRVLSKGFIPDSHLAGFIEFLLLALAVVLLSRLIASYHRTRPSE